MLIIISPSKTQEIGQKHSEEYSIPQFIDQTQQLVEKLQQLSVEELGQTMVMSRKLSNLTRHDWLILLFHPHSLSAVRRCSPFKGMSTRQSPH